MTRANDVPRPGRHSLTVIQDQRRREAGTLEPRRRGEMEPAWRPAGAAAPDETGALRARLRERTADLQRIQAEYGNYRRRVRRDRLAVGEIAVANVLAGLLPVLDAIDQARRQGEVTGGFQRVADVLEAELATLGLESFGAVGDPFDPTLHEAVSYTRTDRVERPTCTAILRPGYRVGDRLLRPAAAEVAEPPVQER